MILAGAAVYVLALAVRVLSWQDNRFEARKVQTVLIELYHQAARAILEGGVPALFSHAPPLGSPDFLLHPPGYPLLLAVVFGVFGESDAAVQLTQIALDCVAAVAVMLIAAELLPRGVAVVASLLAALAPQFSYNSTMLLPDTLAVLPLLLAVYCVACASKRPRWFLFALAGLFVGASCLLRANALLLAPFLATLVFALSDRGSRLRYAVVLICTTVAVIAPVTLRNYVVYKHFVPLSLGAGQTLLEGIADYDEQKRFGVPNTDAGIIKMEAEMYNRPDYRNSLFGDDGIERERRRLAKGFGIIRDNPAWFLSVMIRRAASMLKLERVRVISLEPAVPEDPVEVASNARPAFIISPGEFLKGGGGRAS